MDQKAPRQWFCRGCSASILRSERKAPRAARWVRCACAMCQTSVMLLATGCRDMLMTCISNFPGTAAGSAGNVASGWDAFPACTGLIVLLRAGDCGEWAAPVIGGCPIFPANNIWNVPVDNLPVHSNSANYVASIGTNAGLHLDFGSGLYQGRPIGIPFTTVPAGQSMVPITFEVADESDPGPYPFPNIPIEGGAAFASGDRHGIVIDRGTCKLYEVGVLNQSPAYPAAPTSWTGYSGRRVGPQLACAASSHMDIRRCSRVTDLPGLDSL